MPMQFHMKASGPATILGALGLTQSRVAALFGVESRAIRRLRAGDRPIPRGVQILLYLLSTGVVAVKQVEEAAAQMDGSADPGPAPAAGTDSDPLGAAVPSAGAGLTVAEKVFRLAENACKWPTGDPQGDPAAFVFCGACERHAQLAYREPPRSVVPARLRDGFVRPRLGRLQLSRALMFTPSESFDREDLRLVARARARTLATASAVFVG
jgi:hypothetical protein